MSIGTTGITSVPANDGDDDEDDGR
jgi:hypothetical protein